MQTQLVLNDVRPRPRIHSSAVVSAAAEAFLFENELSMIFPDFSAGDEEWLRENFTETVSASTSGDAWEMAASFARKMDDSVCEEYVDVFERFNSHLSKFQDDVLREWVSSGGAANPLSGGEVFRVEVSNREGVEDGIAFNDPRHAATGKFTFLADAKRSASISPEGDINTLRILEWETIRTVGEPTAEDREIHRRDRDNRIARELKSQARQARAQAEREWNAVLAANPVTDEEAGRIFSALALDEAAAARTVNAIVSVLTANTLKRISETGNT